MKQFSGRRFFFEADDLKQAMSMNPWIALPSASIYESPKARRLESAARNPEELIAQGKYIEAIEQALAKGGVNMSRQVETKCLRRIIKKKTLYWEAFRETVPATLENLCLFIERGDDLSAVDLLSRGARLDGSPRSRGVLLELCEADDMPLTATFMVKNNLIPRNVGLEYFVASLSSNYAAMSYYLAQMTNVSAALQNCDFMTLDLYNQRYTYNMFMYLVRNFLECIVFSRMCETIYFDDLSDAEFIVLIRQGEILKCLDDAELLQLRANPKCNQFGLVTNLMNMAKWIGRPLRDTNDLEVFNLELTRNIAALPVESRASARLISFFLLKSLTHCHGQAA
jgi:hypothetical protein